MTLLLRLRSILRFNKGHEYKKVPGPCFHSSSLIAKYARQWGPPNHPIRGPLFGPGASPGLITDRSNQRFRPLHGPAHLRLLLVLWPLQRGCSKECHPQPASLPEVCPLPLNLIPWPHQCPTRAGLPSLLSPTPAKSFQCYWTG